MGIYGKLPVGCPIELHLPAERSYRTLWRKRNKLIFRGVITHVSADMREQGIVVELRDTGYFLSMKRPIITNS